MAETKQKTAIKPSKRVLDPKKKRRQADSGEPTKAEYAVAKFVRFKCPTKRTTFGHGVNGEDVHYFVGSKAVDCLMESKWSSTSKKPLKKKEQLLFSDRRSCVDYMQQLLMKGLFFRAKKLVPKIKEKPATDAGEKKDQAKKGADAKEDLPKSPKVVKEAEVKRRKKDKGDKEEDKSGKEKQKEKDDGENGGEKGKEKSSKTRKVKLDWHNEQLFIDGPSIYVWKYDPTSLQTWLLGLVIVLGATGCCLFPLWPPQIRAGVYYLSCAALIFFGSFFGFIVLRTILFGIIWAVTLGRHHLWLFPNLSEDCGILESFRPAYSYKYYPPGSKPTKEEQKKSDSEDEGGAEEEGEGGAEDEDARESKDDRAESENENEDEEGKEGESATASQDDIDDYDDKSDASSNEQSSRTSADEEPRTSKEKTLKKRRAVQRDDGQESNNGDFEFVENAKDD